MDQILDLLTMKYGLDSNQVSPEEVVKYMHTREMREKITKFTSLLDENDDAILTDDDVQELSSLVSIAYDMYRTPGIDPIMSDTDYDKLVDLLSMYTGEHDTLIVSDTMDEIRHHKYPMLRGTLTKVHYLETPKEQVNQSRRTLESWVQKTEKLYEEESGQTIDLWEEQVYVFPKWDGISVVFNFDEEGNVEDALTRGFTKFNTAESVRHHFTGMQRPLHGRSYGMKTEIMVTDEGLIEFNETYGKDYKQTRSIASGIINSDDSGEKDNYLVVMQLRYIEDGDQIEKLCPEVFDHPYIKCKLKDVDRIEEFAQKHRFVEGLRCDGAVIHIINPEVQKILGRKDDRNNFEVAYKFTEEWGISTVTGVDFQVGLFGRIAPVAKFKPIKIKGNSISSASLGSVKRMEYLGLAKGDQVKVLYDIIPYVVVDEDCTRSGKDPIRVKEICPSCGERLTRDGAILSCQNLNCVCRKKGAILNYLIKMNIKGLSYETIDTLYEFGIVQSIKDLYKLKDRAKAVTAIPGFGELKYQSWVDEISSKRDVPDYMLFGAIGIMGCSGKTFEKVFRMFTIEDLMQMAKDDQVAALTIANGIGNSKAEAILMGVRENRKLLEFLMDKVGVVQTTGMETKSMFNVCFTKIRNTELEEWIAEHGGKTVDRVTFDTDFVVIPQEGVTSKKTADANDKGVPIVVINDLKSEIRRKYPVISE